MWHEIALYCWWKARWLMKMIFWIVPVAIEAFSDDMGPDAANLYGIGFALGLTLLIGSLIFGGFAIFGHDMGQLGWIAGGFLLLYYAYGFLIDRISWNAYRMGLFPIVICR